MNKYLKNEFRYAGRGASIKSRKGFVLTVAHHNPIDSKKPFITSIKAYKPQLAPRPAYLKASFTLEAAVIIPMFVCFMVFILFLFRVLAVQICMEKTLRYAGMKLAATAYSSYTEDEQADDVINRVAAEAILIEKLTEYNCPKRFIRGGYVGVSLLSSEFDDENIILRAAYDMPFPIRIFGIKTYHFVQCVAQRKWIGESNSKGSTGLGEDTDNPYVYVTPEGVAYHLSKDCNYLDLSIKSVSKNKVWLMRNNDGHKYSKCKECEKAGAIVYVTDYGEAYHSSLTCGSLKRTIIIERLSDALNDRHECPKCGADH